MDKRFFNLKKLKLPKAQSRNQNSSTELTDMTSLTQTTRKSLKKNRKMASCSSAKSIFDNPVKPNNKPELMLMNFIKTRDSSKIQENFPKLENTSNISVNIRKLPKPINRSRNLQAKPFERINFGSTESTNYANESLIRNGSTIRLTKRIASISPFKNRSSSQKNINSFNEKDKMVKEKIIFRGDVNINKDILKCDNLLSYHLEKPKLKKKPNDSFLFDNDTVPFEAFAKFKDKIKVNKKIVDQINVLNKRKKEKERQELLEKEKLEKERLEKLKERIPRKKIRKEYDNFDSEDSENNSSEESTINNVDDIEYEKNIEIIKNTIKGDEKEEKVRFITDLYSIFQDGNKASFKNKSQYQKDIVEKEVRATTQYLKELMKDKMAQYHKTCIFAKYEKYYGGDLKIKYKPYSRKDKEVPYSIDVTPKVDNSVTISGTKYLLDEYFKINSDVVGDYVFKIKNNIFNNNDIEQNKKKMKKIYTKSGTNIGILPTFQTRSHKDNMLYIQKKIYQDYRNKEQESDYSTEEFVSKTNSPRSPRSVVRNVRKLKTTKTSKFMLKPMKRKIVDMTVLKHKTFYDWRKSNSLDNLMRRGFARRTKKSILGEKFVSKTKFMARNSAIIQSPELLHLFTHSKSAFDIVMGLIKLNEFGLIKQILSKNTTEINIDQQDENGNTLLIAAARENLPDIVHFLLEKGAKVNLFNVRNIF